MTAQTRNVLSREAIAKTKKGVRIINCARGGLVDEVALRDALVEFARACRRMTSAADFDTEAYAWS